MGGHGAGPDLLARIDEAMRDVAGVGDEVEISARAGRSGYTRFAGSEITQSSTVAEGLTRVRVLRGRRMGAAQVDSADRDRVRAAAERAAALAALAPEVPDFPGFSRSGEVRGPARAHDAETASVVGEPSRRAGLAGETFERLARRRLEAAGLLTIAEWEDAVRTTGGTAAHQRSTMARIDLNALEAGAGGRGAAGFANDVRTALSSLDVGGVAERAAEIAQRARDPVELPPGAYDVILEPRAVTEILEWMAGGSLGSSGCEDGTGFLAGNQDKRVTGAAITLVDDAMDPDPLMLQAAFDPEGTPKQRIVVVDRGVARTPVLDLLSGRRAGSASTGHAAPLGDEHAEGSTPGHLQMAGGRDTVEDLLGRVERGLWVTRFHYVNGHIDPRRALMTGMTRDGLFLIENGRVGRAVFNLRWTEAILEAFARVDGITAERRAVPRWWSAGGVYLAPTLLVRRWAFTGGSRG